MSQDLQQLSVQKSAKAKAESVEEEGYSEEQYSDEQEEAEAGSQTDGTVVRRHGMSDPEEKQRLYKTLHTEYPD